MRVRHKFWHGVMRGTGTVFGTELFTFSVKAIEDKNSGENEEKIKK